MENENKPADANDTRADNQSAAEGPITNTQSDKNYHPTKETKANHWRDPMFWLLLGTLLATSVAALFTGKQWLTAKDQEKRSLRAYVFVDKASVVLDGRTFKTEVDLKNSGLTPAYDVAVVSHLETREANTPFTPAPFRRAELHKGIMGPQIITNPYAELDVPADNMTTIPGLQNGTVTIYLVGRVAYRDAFKQVWILDFRFQSFKSDGTRWVMQPTENGNQETERK